MSILVFDKNYYIQALKSLVQNTKGFRFFRFKLNLLSVSSLQTRLWVPDKLRLTFHCCTVKKKVHERI